MAISNSIDETIILKYAFPLCSIERLLKSKDRSAMRNNAKPNESKSCVFWELFIVLK